MPGGASALVATVEDHAVQVAVTETDSEPAADTTSLTAPSPAAPQSQAAEAAPGTNGLARAPVEEAALAGSSRTTPPADAEAGETVGTVSLADAASPLDRNTTGLWAVSTTAIPGLVMGANTNHVVWSPPTASSLIAHDATEALSAPLDESVLAADVPTALAPVFVSMGSQVTSEGSAEAPVASVADAQGVSSGSMPAFGIDVDVLGILELPSLAVLLEK